MLLVCLDAFRAAGWAPRARISPKLQEGVVKTGCAKWQFRVWGAALLLALGMSISGCGSSSTTSSNPPPAISIAVSQAPPASLSAGATAMISAAVTNDTAAGGVDWRRKSKKRKKNFKDNKRMTNKENNKS